MIETRQYSTLFSCLHDEPDPVGSLGRGTHYSVLRSVEWLDVTRSTLASPQIHDFAIIWDEDHDTRVIEAVERIYMAGLLSPIQFIGERKGTLTVIVAAKFYFSCSEADIEDYRKSVEAITLSLNDAWPTQLGSFDRASGSPHQSFYEGLIHDRENRIGLYLSNIDSLWSLGTKMYVPKVSYPAPPEIRSVLDWSQTGSAS